MRPRRALVRSRALKLTSMSLVHALSLPCSSLGRRSPARRFEARACVKRRGWTQQLLQMSPGGTQGAAEGSSEAAELPVEHPSPTRPPLLEIFCNIPIEEPPSPERCESPCSAMLCECAKHLTATRQGHLPSEPGRRLRAQEATRPPAAADRARVLLAGFEPSRRSARACCASSCCRPALTRALRVRACASRYY